MAFCTFKWEEKMQFGIFKWYAVKRKCVIKVFLNSQKWKLVCWGFFSPQSSTSERNHFFLKSKVPRSHWGTLFQCPLGPACAGHGAVSGHGEDASTIQSSCLHFLLTLLDLIAPFGEGCEISEPSCPFVLSLPAYPAHPLE